MRAPGLTHILPLLRLAVPHAPLPCQLRHYALRTVLLTRSLGLLLAPVSGAGVTEGMRVPQGPDMTGLLMGFRPLQKAR